MFSIQNIKEMDTKCFNYVYQSSKFFEKNTNCYSVASAKRKTLSLNFYESILLKESNALSEVLLNEELNEYARILDDEGTCKVNNYANHVHSILPNYQNDERKNWKSQLKNFDIERHLKPLPCSNSINCANSTSHNFSSLKTAFQHYKSAGESIPDEKPIFNRTETFYEGKSITSTKSANIQIHNTSLCNQNQTTEDVPKNKENMFFRTARDELQIQRANKNFSSNDKSTCNYNPVKKSLGTRKGGVFGKFQPPLRSSESKEPEPCTSTKLDVDEVTDERLKNIDPAMIEKIKNEIMECGSKITWDDIAGLHLAKSTIQEIVVWPMLRPDIFTGLRRPPKGILLFGPPGTGKTLIGKCIASQSNSTFFSISASSLTSKWVGEGEKMVRTLFAVAKVYQPSVVFVDEIDSLLTKRSDSDHETSRRLKTEFLVQLDGAGTGDDDRILIIGATNRPQELDDAARRRLVKRLYIPLPDEEARKEMIKNLISNERHCLSDSDVETIAKLTEGYSGADVKNLCQEASLGPVRSIPPSMIQNIDPKDVRPLNVKDFEAGLSKIKSSVSPKDIEIYLEWDKQYGCGSAQ